MRSKEDSDEDERAREDQLGAAPCRAAPTVAPRLPAANAEETVDVETLGRRVALSARAPECGVLPSAFQPATSSVRDANFLFNSATRPRRAWSSSTRARRVAPTPSLNNPRMYLVATEKKKTSDYRVTRMKTSGDANRHSEWTVWWCHT